MNQREPWPFEIEIKVIFRDIDAMGHVNNAVFFTYMETARTTFFADRLGLTELAKLPVIVAEATCTYLAPLHMGDMLKVQVGVSRIGKRSFDFAYLMTADADQVVARARTAMVTYDYGQAKAIPIPKTFLEVLQAARSPVSDD